MSDALVIAGAERLGDMLFACGPIDALRGARPRERVIALTTPEAATIVDGAIGLRCRSGSLGRRIYVWRAARALRVSGVSPGTATLIALRDRPRYRSLAARAGLRYEARDILAAQERGHQSARVARALGVATDDDPMAPRLALGPRDVDEAMHALVRAGAEASRRLVILHPCTRDRRLFGGGAGPREWPEDRFAALARALTGDGASVVVVAGRLVERLVARRIGRLSGGAARTLPPVSVRGLAAVLARAALVVSLDTGPLHLAGAVGAPVVGIYGASDPALTGPMGPAERVRVMASASRRPCDATAEAVIETARELLGRRS